VGLLDAERAVIPHERLVRGFSSIRRGEVHGLESNFLFFPLFRNRKNATKQNLMQKVVASHQKTVEFHMMNISLIQLFVISLYPKVYQ